MFVETSDRTQAYLLAEDKVNTASPQLTQVHRPWGIGFRRKGDDSNGHAKSLARAIRLAPGACQAGPGLYSRISSAAGKDDDDDDERGGDRCGWALARCLTFGCIGSADPVAVLQLNVHQSGAKSDVGQVFARLSGVCLSIIYVCCRLIGPVVRSAQPLSSSLSLFIWASGDAK